MLAIALQIPNNIRYTMDLGLYFGIPVVYYCQEYNIIIKW